MLTTRFALDQISHLIHDLEVEKNIFITKAFLFGSVSKGISHKDSDIDVALWSSTFVGCTPIDLELFTGIKSRYPLIEVHTFAEGENADDNPFIEEIEKGILINTNKK
jgi:predicted nucleotidyltransferase